MTEITKMVMIGLVGALVIGVFIGFVVNEAFSVPENTIDLQEYEFLKVFATSHIDESDPNWECKKTIGMYELAKQSYPHFEKNTKWLADKKCGFDVSNITP